MPTAHIDMVPFRIALARRGMARLCILGFVGGAIAGCKDLVGSQPLSAGEIDQQAYDSPEGALLRADGTRALFRVALNQMLLASGTLTDELTSKKDVFDARQLPEGNAADPSNAYDILQNVRVQANFAVNALRTYQPDSLVRRGELFAIQGYAEVMLADLFCSGIPLSLPRSNDDIDYRPGSPTDSVYAHAVTLFDSARVLAGTDTAILTFARVGKGRALLDRGQVTQAAQAVSAIADAAAYQLLLIVGMGPVNGAVDLTDFGPLSVSDREGGHGLPFRSSSDPRTPSAAVTDTTGAVSYAPTRYPSAVGDSVTFTVAGSVEARLIQAEAALTAGQVSQWLATLNALRTSGAFTTTDVYTCDVDRDPGTNVCPGDSTFVRTDTAWSAGTGGVPELHPLADPGTAKARIDMLFAERAYWLYLTGHRQGDLRRLIRQYNQYGYTSNTAYPSGAYAGLGSYGGDVTVPIPTTERRNPHFHGCLNRYP